MFTRAFLLIAALIVAVWGAGKSHNCKLPNHTQPCFDPEALRCRNHGRFAPTQLCKGMHGTLPETYLPRCFNMSGKGIPEYLNVFRCPYDRCEKRVNVGTVGTGTHWPYALWTSGRWSVTQGDNSTDAVVWVNFANMPGYPFNNTKYFVGVLGTSKDNNWHVTSHAVPNSFCPDP
eukprot:TRINITY_DN68129_c7_g1_i1.p1 TRINITY_DN68129_c7_g1~~TRINITY_DN68129_c7_g1_i1.p1  ORF type:complete len:182 (-),score=17.96 TRINITY_DN68129_c7_g1_i1:128-652(-)